MQKKVLIIGSKGMLGQDLMAVFSLDKKYQVFAWDLEEIDITDQKSSSTKIFALQPDLIINAAAYNAVDKAEESKAEFDLALKLNGDAPKYLAEIAQQLKSIFVHYVSDYIFDGRKGEYTENDLPCPINNYGKSKALGEQNVQAFTNKYYLIRTSKLFGRSAQSLSAKKSFFQTMLKLAETRDELQVVNSEKSCFTYTPDLAQATKKLIEEKYPFGIYHLVNEGAVTWLEGAKALFFLAGKKDIKIIPADPKNFPRSAQRPVASVLVNTKFVKLRNYQEAIKDWLSTV